MEIQIKGRDIDGDLSSCLGPQLTKLMGSVKAKLGNVVWFVADIDTVTGVPNWYSGKFSFVEIGHTETMMALSRTVLQYLSGVFIALRPENVQWIYGLEADTEDTAPFFLEQSVLEIRAFDQTFFLIHTHDRALAEYMLQQFNGEVSSRGPLE